MSVSPAPDRAFPRALTGLGRANLRAEMIAAGIEIRPTGRNQPGSQQRRARDVDTATATRIGVIDITEWLVQQRHSGWSIAELAAHTGRSDVWGRARLRGATTTR